MQYIAPDEGLTTDTSGMDSTDTSATSSWTSADSGVAMKGFGGGTSAFGSLYAGQMESQALSAQANVQRQNAELDLAAGKANAARSQMLGGQRMGAIQGAAAAGGVTQSGSVLSVMAASAMNSEMDRQNILHGSQVKAVQADNQASMDDIGSKSAQEGSYMSAAGGIISTAATIAMLA